MSLNRNIEELVDRLLTGLDADEEIKKRRPKPFRYITDKNEIQAILSEGNQQEITVMKTSARHKIVDEQLAVIGLGNVETIENILRKHQASRKLKR